MQLGQLFQTAALGGALMLLGACNSSTDVAEQGAQAVDQAAQAANMAPPAGAMGGPEGMGAGGMAAGGMGDGAGMGAPPDESSTLIPTSKITYKAIDGKDLQLHIFNPAGHKAGHSAPAVVFYHGGGFRRGSPQAGYDLSERLNALGVVLVVPEYRMFDEGGAQTLDDIMSDSKSAVRYMRANAAQLGIDSDRIITSGHSAGAYLAATTGLIDGFDGDGEDTTISAMSNGMILWSMGARRTNPDIMGPGRTAEDYQPSNYIDVNLAPSLFIHGGQDTLISPDFSKGVSEDISAAGNKTRFVLIEEGDHFFRDAITRGEAFDATIAYLKEHGFTG